MEADDHIVGYFTCVSVRLHTVMVDMLKNNKIYNICEKTSGTLQ